MTSFALLGPAVPDTPVVLSVPHAGRDYPLALRSALRAPPDALTVLEDRFVDRIAIDARTDETLLVQRLPRAWIDLNRGEQERDPRLDEGANLDVTPAASAKVRSGLGIVPRRTAGAGDLWRRRFSADEIEHRIAVAHRPYHAALARALTSARDRFGAAVLLDVHSMPPLGGRGAAQVVIGDRFGRAAAARFVHRVEGEVEAAGLRHALNAPYAGGHVLDRHGHPAAGIHAVQIEFDRGLYLDARLDAPGPGLARTTALLRRIIDSLADEALASPAIAAE